MCKLEEKGFEARNEKRGVADARAVNSVATGGTDGRRGEGGRGKRRGAVSHERFCDPMIGFASVRDVSTTILSGFTRYATCTGKGRRTG